MPKTSAGLLLYRINDDELEVFLVHPGGPYWRHKDAGTWSIPKGEIAEGDDLLATAHREFLEETGIEVEGHELELGSVRQAGGKIVHAWAIEGDLDPKQLRSNTFELEWPRHSGRIQTFPEVDRGEWFRIEEARERMLSAQTAFLDALLVTFDRLN